MCAHILLHIAAATHIPNHLKTFVHGKVQKSVKTNWEIAARESTVLHKCVCIGAFLLSRLQIYPSCSYHIEKNIEIKSCAKKEETVNVLF